MSKLICPIYLTLMIVMVGGCATPTIPTTPLHDAVHQKNEKNVKSLLDNGAEINAIGGRYGETPLMLASREGSFDVVELLIDEEADVNVRGAHGDTALIAAAWNCQRKIAEYLIKEGAQVNIKNDSYGSTALNIVAGECNDKDFIHLLLYNGANIHLKNKGGDSPLFSAVKEGHPGIVNLLLEAGANINERNDGYTALMIAALRGNVDVASLLIDKKIDINAKNNSNRTALDIAKANRDSEMVKLLEQAGAKEAPKKRFGFQPFYMHTPN